MSLMPSIVYLATDVLVMEEEYIISLFPAFKYSRSLLKKNSIGFIAEASSASALQVLRRLGSIFTSLYAAKLKRVVSLLEGLRESTWDDLILYLEGPYDVKESRVMDMKLCYNTFKFKEDSPDNEEDTRSSHEYLNDLDEEYQARALLAKSKRFFKKGTQSFSSAKATNQTEGYKYGKKAHFARDSWSKTSVPSYQSPFQPKLLHSSEHKPEPRRTKDFKAKYNKVKAKLALLSSSVSTPSSSSCKNKGLIAKMYDWDEEVSFDDNEVTEVKALMELTDEERRKILGIDELTKDTSSPGPKDPVFVKSSVDNSKVSITSSNKPKLSETKESTQSNHDTGKVPSNESQRNITDHSAVVSDSSTTDYDSANESLVYSDSNREEIDIFSGPDDSIPPGIESDFDSEEDIIDNLLNNDPIPEYERLTFIMEPDVPVINNEDECFDPGGGEINVEVDDSFTFVTRTFLPYLTYPEVSSLLSSTKNEDTIFDPGIST
ncbi:hypothetical protein Tco_0268998 [Tanacetum coccineum]